MNETKQACGELWGLRSEIVADLGNHLTRFWARYAGCVSTKTRTTHRYGLAYISGLLRIEHQRTMAEIGRKTGVSEQNMQHFISHSPWSGRAVIEQIQQDIKARAEFSEAMLIIDESADVKAGDHSAGSGHQYNGRLGKLARSQVGVFATLVQGHHWSWIDGELFLPEAWFSDGYADKRTSAGVPVDRSFETKIELAWRLIKRVQDNGVPFVGVAFDSLYGRNTSLRDRCQAAGIDYYADVPCDSLVYLEPPTIEFPLTQRGTPRKKPRVIGTACQAYMLVNDGHTDWQTLTLRPSERGMLVADFARRAVWTTRHDGTVVAETLLLRRDGAKLTYTLTNAPAQAPVQHLAQRKAQRSFVERSIQDAKSELGWDDFRALKYRAWEHQLALTILASWFVAELRLDWERDYPADLSLYDQYQTDVLPALSMANIRELLLAAIPLPQLSTDDAIALVVKHLDNRTRSRRSRLKRRM